ncbi:MAG TPA: hypothetical protein ENI79_03795 [Rhodospirillales bacterium]|nr:hypothetical protein [Rhodospirillales bacterium]
MQPTDRINDLINITSRLADLLMRENAALREKRHKDVAGLLDEKSTLSRAYEARVKGLRDIAEDLGEVDEDLRERLRGLGEKVKDLMVDNAHFLKVEMEVNQRVMSVIADAAKSQKPGPETYSAKGSTKGKGVDDPMKNVAVSIDQSL